MLSQMRYALLILGLTQLVFVSAQFFNFDNIFGHGGRQQQQQPAGGHSQWMAHSESVPCSDYLCPDTLSCVARPEDCPCPNIQDVKCIIQDAEDEDSGTVLCVRGASDCQAVNRLAMKLTK